MIYLILVFTIAEKIQEVKETRRRLMRIKMHFLHIILVGIDASKQSLL